MPGMTSAQKAARQAARREIRNKAVRSRLKTLISKAGRLIMEKKDLEAASQAAQQAILALDKAANKGVIHHNNAARRKSRLMKKLNSVLSAKPA